MNGSRPPDWAKHQADEEILQHCTIDLQKESGKYRVCFKAGRATMIAFEITPFQLWLLGEAMIAGGRVE